jgi:hypothetical protein
MDDEPPLPPPPMCFMAKHSKVSDSDSSGSSSSDDELSPLALKDLLDEYTFMIKKQKSKLKALDETHEKLKLSYDELLVKHNDCDNPPRKILYYRLNQSTLVIKR